MSSRDVKNIKNMQKISEPQSLLLDFFDRCFLFMSKGRSGPYAAALGREEYERIIEAKNLKKRFQTLKRLQNQKLIELNKRGEKFFISLTKDGVLDALQNRIIAKEELLPGNKVCLVSFDFPIKLDRNRNSFRDLLRRADFSMRHQSVWITRNDVVREMAMLVKILKAEDWIHVYLAEPQLTSK